MKVLSLIFILLAASQVSGQQTDPPATMKKHNDAYKIKTFTASVSLGVADYYRGSYSLPSGFQKVNTTGFAPVYARAEYGFFPYVSLAAYFVFDGFNYNFNQEYQGFNGEIVRYKVDDFRLYGGGVTGYYHLGRFIHAPRLDPFVGIGITLNNVRYGGKPQGDSQVEQYTHVVAPYLKVGARYYISKSWSLFGDLGYDQQSILSLGLSCRFHATKHTTTPATNAQPK